VRAAAGAGLAVGAADGGEATAAAAADFGFAPRGGGSRARDGSGALTTGAAGLAGAAAVVVGAAAGAPASTGGGTIGAVPAGASLVLGAGAGALEVPAAFDARQLEDDRISAVHYLRFPLRGDARARFLDPEEPARLRIAHPRYAAEADLPEVTRASLIADLESDPPPLLGAVPPLPSIAETLAPTPSGALLAEGVRVRALRPAQPRAAGHVILESRGGESLAGADPALLCELARFAERFGAELAARHGPPRLEADLSGPLRWHLLAGTWRAGPAVP